MTDVIVIGAGPAGVLAAWADGHDDGLPEMAADLVRNHVAVIATPLSTQAAIAARSIFGKQPRTK